MLSAAAGRQKGACRDQQPPSVSARRADPPPPEGETLEILGVADGLAAQGLGLARGVDAGEVDRVEHEGREELKNLLAWPIFSLFIRYPHVDTLLHLRVHI